MGLRKIDGESPVLGIGYNQGGNTEGNLDQTSSINLTYKLGSRLKLSFSPSYSKSKNIVYNHEIYNWYDDSAKVWHSPVPQLEQTTISTGIRFDYTISPVISLQTFIQPLIWQGKYSDFKEFSSYDSYTFTKLDEEDIISNYSALMLNSVFRWEFSPGSTFYLVWTRNTELSSSNEIFELMSNTVDLLIEEAANHLAIKITYWID